MKHFSTYTYGAKRDTIPLCPDLFAPADTFCKNNNSSNLQNYSA